MQGTYSKKMLVDLDMQNNEILGLRPEVVTTLPTTDLAIGRLVIKGTSLYVCVSTTGEGDQNWKVFSTGGDLSLYQALADKGQANGYAGLDSSAKVPIAQLPTVSSGNITDGDTTHVPTADAVYDAITSAVTGLYKIKGSATVSEINNAGATGGIAQPVVGDVYNVTDAGTITLGNIQVLAGDNVVYVKTADSPATYAWDKLAGTVDVSNFVTLTGAQTVDGKTFTNVVSINGYTPGQAMAKGVDISTGSLNTTDDTTVPTSKLVASAISTSASGKMDKFASAPSQANQLVVTQQSDADTISYMTGSVASGGKTLMYVSSGALTASTATEGGIATPVYLKDGVLTHLGDGTNDVGSATTPIYMTKNGVLTAGTQIGTAGYKQADTGTISSSSTDDQVPTSLTVYEALTGGVVTKVGTSNVGTSSKPVYLNAGVPTAVSSIDASLLPSGIAYIYTATITANGTASSWTLPLNSDVYTDPASVSIRDSDGYEVGMNVQYTDVSGVKHVVLSVNKAPANGTVYTVKIVA